jgi:uncharacterized membrane-anchored protein
MSEPALFPDYDALIDYSDMSDEDAAETRAAVDEVLAFNAKLTPQTGIVDLDFIGVKLDLGENHYFIPRKDARDILEDQWGNPADPGVLGMIFERGSDHAVNQYAVEISYNDTGYVSDKDAANIDYDDLLAEMQDQAQAENIERVAEGYGTAELLGWAQSPVYDGQAHQLFWAKSLQFSDTEGETLNYNHRFLDRRGVLEFNYIAVLDELETVNAAIPDMGEMVVFEAGHRYSDFDATTDKVATYGVAGLIAGGVVAKKAGLLAILLLFLKKGWIILLAGGAFLMRFVRGMFGRKETDNVG